MASVPPFTRFLIVSIKEPMLCVLIAAVDSSAPPSSSVNSGFGGYGIVFWLLLVLAAISVSITIERILLYRREQIDFAQFLAGVRTVLKRDNVLEALSICEATPGPVARLVKAAILAREGGREKVAEAIYEAGRLEMPILEARLPFLSTVTQIAPLLGVLGTLLGFAGVFHELRQPGSTGIGLASGYAAPGELFGGVLSALYSAALGVGLAVVGQASHNYLISKIDLLQRDLERAGHEALKLLTPDGSPSSLGGTAGNATNSPPSSSIAQGRS